MRLGLGRLGMRFACFRDGLRADAVFGADERQQVAEFGRVEHNRRDETGSRRHSRDESPRRRRCDRPLHLGGRHFGPQMQGEPASLDVRLEERINGGYGDLRLESDARDPAVAGIEMRAPAGIAGKRPIVIAQRIAQVGSSSRCRRKLSM